MTSNSQDYLSSKISYERTYNIFGKNIRIGFSDSYSSRILENELSLYPLGKVGSKPEYVINNVFFKNLNSKLTNPSNHYEFENGFVIHLNSSMIRFVINNKKLKKIDFWIKGPDSKFWKFIQRMRSTHYCTVEDQIGLFFHENVLIPSIFFNPDLFLIHGSAFQTPSKDVILIGGTGGVGKTTIEIELCLNKQYKFVADDMSVVSKDGFVWPNLEYPKIYAYNLEGNPILKERVLKARPFIDKLHWKLKKRISQKYVLRRVSPKKLYGTYSKNGGKLKNYFILIRENRKDFKKSQIKSELASSLSLDVIKNEYSYYNKFFIWHEYNRKILGKKPYISLEYLFKKWEDLANLVFSSINCYLIRIPNKINHQEFRKKIIPIVEEKS